MNTHRVNTEHNRVSCNGLDANSGVLISNLDKVIGNSVFQFLGFPHSFLGKFRKIT
jgi:hypothetical protein